MPNKIRVIRKIRVQTSRAKSEIREIREIRVPKNIRVIRVIRVQKNLVFKCAEKHSCYSCDSCSKNLV